LDAALAGYRFIGVELEARFCALAHGFDCGGSDAKHEACSQQESHEPHHVTGNLELWQRRYGHLPQWVAPTLLQGDSRALGTVLRDQITACVASPPFGAEQSGGGIAITGTPSQRKSPGSTSPVGYQHQGTAPGQLGALPPGSLDAAIASPPHVHGLGKEHTYSDHAKRERDSHSGIYRDKGIADPYYGSDPAQLGNLPAGSLDACLSSPPYADGCHRTGGTNTPPAVRGDGTAFREGQSMAFTHYGSAPAQLGNLPAGSVEAAISSPPYEASVTVGHAPEKDIARAVAAGHTLASMGNPGGQLRYAFEYGTDPAQLGNEHGTTFWEASKQILEQVVALLKPNGIAVWVVKSYVREGQIVDFPGQWRTLCESLGLVTLHEHHALLVEDHGTQGSLFGADTTHRTERKSFFRRLHEKKRPDLAIDYEVVLCMQKREGTTAGNVEVCVSSPPYAAHTVHGNDGIDWARASNDGQTRGQSAAADYGHTEGQLGAMPAGSLDACVSSPPYNLPMSQDHNGSRGGARGTTPSEQGAFVKYGSTPGQLEGMPPGSLDAVVSSPPYAASFRGQTETATRIELEKRFPHWHTGGRSQLDTPRGYGTTPGNLGNLPEGLTP